MPPPPAITTLLSMSMSPFSFPLYPSTLIPLPIAAILFSIYESLFVLIVSSVCLLDSTKREIMWYLFFSDWLILLSIIFSRPTHAVAKGKISFFFMAKKKTIVYMFHSFIYSSTDGHLGCFHILETINNSAMNTRVLMFF